MSFYNRFVPCNLNTVQFILYNTFIFHFLPALLYNEAHFIKMFIGMSIFYILNKKKFFTINIWLLQFWS